MRALGLGLCVLVLCGCSWDVKWVDVTGQGRDQAAAKIDHDDCYKRAGFPKKGDAMPSQDVLRASAAVLRNCMTERGWKPDR